MDLIGTEAPDTITLQNAANTCAAYSGWICALRGETGQVKTRFEQSQWLADAIDNSFARAIHLSLFADVATCGEDLGLGRDLARDAITLSREHGYPFWLGTALVIEGWWLGQAGDFDAGLSAIDEGIAIFEATDAGVQLPNWFGLRAETLLAADRPADSVTDAEKALAHADLTGDQWFAPRIHATLSRAMTRLGDTEGAARHDALVSRYVSEWGLSPSFAALRDRAV
jgi:predicted ATPase